MISLSIPSPPLLPGHEYVGDRQMITSPALLDMFVVLADRMIIQLWLRLGFGRRVGGRGC